MFPATPSSSTWHGRRGYPALASWGSRRRNRRHMTGGTGRSVGTPWGASCSPRAWSRAEAGSEGAGARAGGVEGSRSRSRKRRWPPEWWRTGSIFLPGGVQESAGSTVSGTSRLEATGPGGFEVLEGACPGPTDLEGRTGRRPQGGWSRVDLEGGAAGSRGPWGRVASPASWGRGHASRGGARSPGEGADLQELGRVSGGGASLPGRKEESGRAELRTGTQKSLSFTSPFLSGFLGTRSRGRSVWEPHASLPLLNLALPCFHLGRGQAGRISPAPSPTPTQTMPAVAPEPPYPQAPSRIFRVSTSAGNGRQTSATLGSAVQPSCTPKLPT